MQAVFAPGIPTRHWATVVMGMVQWSGVVCDSQGVTDSPIVHLSEVFDWSSCYFLLSQGVISNFSDFGAADHDIVHEQPGRVRIYTGRNLVFTCFCKLHPILQSQYEPLQISTKHSIPRVDSLRWVRLKWYEVVMESLRNGRQQCATRPAELNQLLHGPRFAKRL